MGLIRSSLPTFPILSRRLLCAHLPIRTEAYTRTCTHTDTWPGPSLQRWEAGTHAKPRPPSPALAHLVSRGNSFFS